MYYYYYSYVAIMNSWMRNGNTAVKHVFQFPFSVLFADCEQNSQLELSFCLSIEYAQKA